MISIDLKLSTKPASRPALRDQKPRLQLTPIAAGIHAVLLSCVLGAAVQPAPTLAQSLAATAPADSLTRTFDVPAGPLGVALERFARAAGVKLSYDAALLVGLSSKRLVGTFSAAAALAALLAETGLEGAAQPDGGFVLRKAAVASVQSPANPPQSSGSDKSAVTDNSKVSKENKPNEASDGTLAAVVVTGTKRAQTQQQATQSVSVLKEQDTIGMQNGFDVFARLPNVVQQSDTFLPVVRGLDGNGVATGGGGAVSGASPRMSSYVDGVARTFGATPDGEGSFWDMSLVEVYKGAQSTQLGQNSIAGAIVQTTKDPQFKDEYALQFGVRNQRTTYNAALMANKVLGERLAIRFAAEAVDGKNPIDYAGFEAGGLTAADRDELGRINYGRYRFKALFLATDQLTLKLTAEQERRKNPYTSDGAANSGRRELISERGYGGFDSINNIVALNANYEISPEWVFDTVLSQQKANTKFGPPRVGSPDPAAFLSFSFQSNETALESKLAYKASQGRTSAVFGAFVKTRKRDDLGVPGSSFELQADDSASARSLFADATIQLAPQWDVLVAARLQNDQQKRTFSALGGDLAFSFDEGNRVFLPKLGATFHASPDASFSLLTYKGYNASGGGVSFRSFTPYLYKKETAQTVELVARTQWLDRKLTANANVFRTQLKDAQASGIGPAGPTDVINVNIAKARTQGLEFELVYQPNPRQKLQLGLGLLNTKIIDFGSEANNVNNGNQLALSPRISANVGGSIEVLPQLTVGGNVTFVGKRFSDYTNTPEDRLAGYATANLNAQYRVGKFTVTGYVNNLFNRFVQTTRSTLFDSANVNDPRTVGVNFKAEF